MIRIEELTRDNFKDFVYLMKQRGHNLPEFYRWKYITTARPELSSGYLAFNEDKVIGCIGKVNRTFINTAGEISTANWFADWYISSESRSTGSGKALMQKVAGSATIGLGIPGPAHAQLVAKKSGYQPLDGFFEVHIPLKPYRVGYKKFPGMVPVRMLRAAWEVLIAAKTLKQKKISSDLQEGFPDIAKWLIAANDKLKNLAHLKRDEAYLTWFSKLPLPSTSNRRWWHYNSDKMFAVGFSETDSRGLKQARVMELLLSDKSDSYSIKKLLYMLKQNGDDIALMLTDADTLKQLYFPGQWCKSLPVHITSTAISRPYYLSLLDKESSWIIYPADNN